MKSNLNYFIPIILFISTISTYSKTIDTPSVEREISNFLKQQLKTYDEVFIKEKQLSHLKDLKLLTLSHQWATPFLESRKNILLPNVRHTDIEALVDNIAENIEKNPYFHRALTKCPLVVREELLKKLCPNTILDVMVYAFTLETLTKAMAEDIKITKEITDVWSNNLSYLTLARKAGSMLAVKYWTVKKPLDLLITYLEKGKVLTDFTSFIIPINILEVGLIDALVNKNYKNAYASFVLGTSWLPKTSASSSSQISTDGKSMEVYHPFNKNWVDLYQAWNFSFIAGLQSFPYWSTKLLIPSVSGYQSNPEHYFHKRVLSLFCHLNFIANRRIDNNGAEFDSLDCVSPSLTKAFNNENFQSTSEYLSLFEANKLSVPLWPRIANSSYNIFLKIRSYFYGSGQFF